MTKEQIQQCIEEGHHFLRNGEDVKVDGDLWKFLDSLDEEDNSVVLLEYIVK
ncbi:hypothetical protein EDC17_101179 [Sphingobacterium alimentarium]|uniref:Uncharacterized protein n=1 Tax=Sphingobacterium alimentarium TaxID=797292 RepID=A0A4R3W067_9SPHI|nr:hypothetical protein [Sphingobacterium alimentarium]TCV17160.1 hypothetical protein EDC17_101179 [Sphingobacterium alimentarium]